MGLVVLHRPWALITNGDDVVDGCVVAGCGCFLGEHDEGNTRRWYPGVNEGNTRVTHEGYSDAVHSLLITPSNDNHTCVTIHSSAPRLHSLASEIHVQNRCPVPETVSTPWGGAVS